MSDYLECPCCGEGAVPAATRDDLDGYNVPAGLPVWIEGQEARCSCGCLVSVYVDGEDAVTTAACATEGLPDALAACPCVTCREAAEVQREVSGE